MKLSVCVITFNHELFISESLESILRQETSFPFEVVIGEDGSSDLTRKICENYQIRYPDKIRLLPAEGNKGMMRNFIDTYFACKGEFVAFIEGDDYWIDPLKLEKQVNFLSTHPEYSICFHNVMTKFMRTNENAERVYHQDLGRDTFTTVNLIQQWFIPSASVMFRRYPDFQLPDWFVYCKSGDIPFLLLLSLRGPIKYINEVMSVYRVHDKGISTTHNGYNKIVAMIYIYECFNIHTQFKFAEFIKSAEKYEIDRHYPKPVEKKVDPKSSPGILSKLMKKLSVAVQTQ